MDFQSLLSAVDSVYVAKVSMALFIGFVIGFEREYRAKPAGLKTYAMICLGATLITHVSLSISPYADPSRIAAQIVSGLGFVGAGAIFQSKRKITGLTTAATLWLMGAMGLLVGAGFFVEALVSLCFILAYFFSMRLFQGAKFKRNRYTIFLKLQSEQELPMVEQVISKYRISLVTKLLSKEEGYTLQLIYLCKSKANENFIRELINIVGVQQLIH